MKLLVNMIKTKSNYIFFTNLDIFANYDTRLLYTYILSLNLSTYNFFTQLLKYYKFYN